MEVSDYQCIVLFLAVVIFHVNFNFKYMYAIGQNKLLLLYYCVAICFPYRTSVIVKLY